MRQQDIGYGGGGSFMILLKIPGYGIMHAAGKTVPSGVAGFCPGAVFQDIDAAAGAQLFVNEGSVTSCTFVALPTGGTTGAADIGIADAGNFTAQTTVEAALQELYQNAISIQKSIPLNIALFLEVSSGNDVSNIAANGGILASDTTPVLRGDAANTIELSWATANVDAVLFQTSLPADLDDTADVTLDLWVNSGSTDAATFAVATCWDGGTEVADSADDSATKSATTHKITATIATADVPAGSSNVTVRLTPGAHGTNAVQLRGARLNYKSKLLTS